MRGKGKPVETPVGKIFERRATPKPRAIVSAQKGAGTAALSLLGIVLPTLLAWLAMPANVESILSHFTINPALAAIIVSLVTGLAKFAWDYFSRKYKAGKDAKVG